MAVKKETEDKKVAEEKKVTKKTTKKATKEAEAKGAEAKDAEEKKEAPKKKQMSFVFRPENSKSGKLLKVPGGVYTTKPAAKKKTTKKSEEEEEVKETKTKKTTKKAALTETEEPKKKTKAKAKSEEDTETAEVETEKKTTKRTKKTETTADEEPKKKTKSKAKAKEEDEASKTESEEKSEEKPEKKSTKKTTKKTEEEEKQEKKEPEKPVEIPRFVDMEAVRRAERGPAKSPTKGPKGSAKTAGKNGTPKKDFDGPRAEGGRNNRKPDFSHSVNTGRRQGAQPGAFEMAMQKPGKKGRGQGNRYDKRNNDEMRRPGGAKVSNKDMLKAPVKKQEPEEAQIKMITIPEVLTIKQLADTMKIQPATIIKKLFMQGQIVTLNDEIDYEQAENIAVEFDVLCEKEIPVDVIAELLEEKIEDSEESLVGRPPVVCVMGHVDHGKTSLLDAIRKTNVISKEAGGITQAIGAYMVDVNGRAITFLDTPGHEAFTAMRMRGAQATDIAILVVAADDGVMPQTIEAINHAKAAEVEIIVAINKIDKPGADINKVKQELTEYGLVDSEWGGETTMVPISAKKGEGINDLLEMVLLQADVLELKANPNRKARGLVIEAKLDKGRGPVATILVQKGTLHVGDTIAAGSSYGKIRAMISANGERVKEATPSTPVEILGLNDVPNAGEIFVSTENEKDARTFAETFIAEEKKRLVKETKGKVSLDDIFDQIKEGELKELNLIVKADVQGSVEAVKESLTKLSNDEVVVKVIHSAAGNINESDVTLASASNAIIIGFNVKIDATAKNEAESENIDVRLYDVIYKAIEDVELAMKGMLDPIFEEKVLGHAVVRQTFKSSQAGIIAGSFVLDGKMVRGSKIRITRDGEQIYEGVLSSLKRFKDDAKEVKEGFECGIVFDDFKDLQEDDQIEAYEMVEVARK